MSIKNLNASAPNIKAAETSVNNGRIEELKADLRETANKLANTDDMSSYLSYDQQSQISETKLAVDAEIKLLETYQEFIATGEWDLHGVDIGKLEDKLSGMASGWNDMGGNVVPTQIESDAALAGGTYAGTIMLQNSGKYDPLNPQDSNALAFVADDDVSEIYGKTIGNDVHVQVHHVDGSVETYVLKNMATRPEDLIVYGGDRTEPITMDFSQVLRISDGNWGKPFGESSGLILFGSKGNDRIVGSQGDDIIVGGSGDDKLFGLAGNDDIYGDQFNDKGTVGFTAEDGNDYIDGGAGRDIMRAGGGNQDVIINKANQDSASEHENPGATESYEQPAIGSFISGVNGKYDKTGVLHINAADAKGSPINISMPDGYTMASAGVIGEGGVLTITMAGFDVNGNPHTLLINIDNYFSSNIQTTINFSGNGANNILDFHQIKIEGGNVLNILGKDGNDTIIAPQTYFDKLGIPYDELGKTTVGYDGLDDILNSLKTTSDKNDSEGLNWGFSKSKDDYRFWSNGPGPSPDDVSAFIHGDEIVLALDAESTSEFSKTLDFAMPAGYTDVVRINEANGDIKLVFINGDDQAVVRLTGVPAETKINVGGLTVSVAGKPSTVSGGSGNDSIYASAAGIQILDAENVTSGLYPYTSAPKEVASNETAEDEKLRLITEISALQEEIGKLEKKVDNKNYKDQAALDKLNEEIADKYDQISTKENRISHLEETENV